MSSSYLQTPLLARNCLLHRRSDQKSVIEMLTTPHLDHLDTGNLRSSASRSAKSTCSSRHLVDGVGKISCRSSYYHRSIVFGSCRNRATDAVLGQCCRTDDRVIWEESCDSTNTPSISHCVTRGTQQQHENSCYGKFVSVLPPYVTHRQWSLAG